MLFVILYHGNETKRQELRRSIRPIHSLSAFPNEHFFPVVLTSYEVVLRDRKVLQSWKWGYFVLDEGHRIKNFNCKLHSALKELTLESRLLMTGTPLQNNLTELWSLLNFLLPMIFRDKEWFLSFFDFSDVLDKEARSDGERVEKMAEREQSQQMIEKLHGILGTFMKRREKKDVELSLPPKKELLIHAPMTVKQQQMYRQALEGCLAGQNGKGNSENPEDLMLETKRDRKSLFDLQRVMKVIENDEDLMVGYDDGTTDEKNKNVVSVPSESVTSANVRRTLRNLNSVRSMMMTLRKITNHPHLIEWEVDGATDAEYVVDETMISDSGKMLVLDCLLEKLHQRGHKVLLFTQMTLMLDILRDYCAYRNYNFAHLDGRMNIDEREEQIDKFNGNPTTFIMLVSTRAGGLGLNLTAADTVIIYDSDWNPQMDVQAQDRCHRIGQTRPVMVYRIACAGTIDERMIGVAQNKRRLEKIVINTKKFRRDSAPISAKELLDLLSSVDYGEKLKALEEEGTVLSKETLEKILDRSDMVAAVPVTKQDIESKQKSEDPDFVVLTVDHNSVQL